MATGLTGDVSTTEEAWDSAPRDLYSAEAQAVEKGTGGAGKGTAKAGAGAAGRVQESGSMVKTIWEILA